MVPAVKEKHSEIFSSYTRLPLPIMVTDSNGIVLYKNLMANTRFNIIRIGINIKRHMSDDAFSKVCEISEKSIPCAVKINLVDTLEYCLVCAKRNENGGSFCIYSAVPYSHDRQTMERICKHGSCEYNEYLEAFEKQTNYLISVPDGNGNNFSDKERTRIRNNAGKILRLENRFKSLGLHKFSAPKSDAVHFCEKIDINKMSAFLSKIINENTLFTGFQLIYVPSSDKGKCLCNLEAGALVRTFIYASMFCIKHSKSGKATVKVNYENGNARIVIETTCSHGGFSDFSIADFSFIEAYARLKNFDINQETDSDGNLVVIITCRSKTEA